MNDTIPDAVVLVGGMGTRLRQVVADRPKPLADVAGRPFLCWLLSHLAHQGVRRVILSAGHQAKMIEAFAEQERERTNLELVVVTEPAPLGTGGALRLALSEVETSEVLVLNGDSFCAANLVDLIRLRREGAARAILLLTEVPDTSRFGSVEVAKDGEILAFREKIPEAGPGLINAGVYLIPTADAAEIPADQVISIESDVFPGWVGRGLFGVVSIGPFIDIGTPESLAWANTHLNWSALTGAAEP